MTKDDDLKQCKIAIEFALKELMDGRTFYDEYFKSDNWKYMSRTDRAICILCTCTEDSSLGEPMGFDKIKTKMERAFFKKQK